ncbi:peptide MFS transporter [Campylobacter sp. MIT 99-7217]|uniref:peptide MFS transporter n=1 Tax=Campylobacter sp. MIT 99-7217 TaxID=535091 RepID=UPI003917BA3B
MTELWERFSFYGIRPLLVLFMSATLLNGGLGFSKEEAAAIAGIFGGSLYLATLPGAWVADNFLGQNKSVLIGSIIIALGHLSIALSYYYTPMFFIGLALIVIGTGLFKTCASVMVGTLYKKDDPRRDSGFTIFYMGINLGGFIAPLVTGFLQVQYGWHLGFGIGGLGMLLALLIFVFKTMPDFKEFDEKVGISEAWNKPSKENKKAFWIVFVFVLAFFVFVFLILTGLIKPNALSLAKNMVSIVLWSAGAYFIYLFFFCSLNSQEKKNLIIFIVFFCASSVFWSVFEQQYTTYNFFADKLTNKNIFGYEVPTTWFQSINSLFIIIFAPIVGAIWVFLARKGFELSSLSKFALGLIFAALGFIVMAFATEQLISVNGGISKAQELIASGQGILASAWWIVLSFFFLTLGELCLSPVGLSIMSKIAPKLIQSQVMGLWFVSISVGNVMAGLIGGKANEENLADLSGLFYECVWILLIVAAVLFIFKKIIQKISSKE